MYTKQLMNQNPFGGIMKADMNNQPTNKNWFIRWLRIGGMVISVGSFFLLFSSMGIAGPPIPLPPLPPGLPHPPLPLGPPLPHRVLPHPPILVPPHPPGPGGSVWVPGYHRGHRWVPGYWSRPKRYRPRYDPGPRYDHRPRYDRGPRYDHGPPPHPGPLPGPHPPGPGRLR